MAFSLSGSDLFWSGMSLLMVTSGLTSGNRLLTQCTVCYFPSSVQWAVSSTILPK